MQGRTGKIGIACAFGAGIGALVALQMAHSFSPNLGGLWSALGAFIGGLISYLTYDFKGVVASVRKNASQIWNWRPNEPFWMTLMMTGGIFFLGMLLTVALPIGFFLKSIAMAEHKNEAMFVTFFVSAALFGIMALAFGSSIGVVARDAAQEGRDWRKIMLEYRKQALFFNSIGFCVGIIYFAFVIIGSTFRLIHLIKRNLPRFGIFCKRVFVDIHSDIRVLCFVDGGIGAAVGFFSGNALIGAVVGGVLGVVNYEIVSIRLLKLARVRE